MSIIQTIRDRAAWIVIVAIALALIAFIVQDAFSGGGLFNRQSTTLGKVDGKEIDAVEYEERYKRAEEIYRQQGYPLNDVLRNNIRESLWNEYVDDAIMLEKYEKLGITVSDRELSDILYGANPPQDLRQQFTDPNTGEYDPNAAYQQIEALRKQRNTPQYISFFHQYLPALAKNRQREKYQSLLVNTAYAPKWLAEEQQEEAGLQSSFSYVFVPYSTVPDTAVRVTDQAITDYVKRHEQEYQEEASVSLEYVLFDASPTSEDSAAVLEQVQALKDEFAKTEDIRSFLIRNGSETVFQDAFVLRSKIRSEFTDSITALKAGEVYGPYLENGNYVISKLIDRRVMPDSVKVRHILIKTADQGMPTLPDSVARQRIDSIVLAIRKGTSFDEMVRQYSDDPGSKETGGEYDFSSSQFAGISKEFAEAIFYGFAGDAKVVKVENPSYAGYHYIEVLRQSGFEPAFKIAHLSRAILPSQETLNRQNGLASQFAAESRDRKSFDENARKNNYNKLVAVDIRPLDANIIGLGTSREIVRWAFESKPGTVSEIPFQVGDYFVVPVVVRKYEAGLMAPDKARPLVESFVRNELKAGIIAEKIGKPATLEAAATATGQQVARIDSLHFTSFFVPNIGQESRLIGAAFNPAFREKLSLPINGQGGVFVIQVHEIISSPDTSTSIADIRDQIAFGQRRALSNPALITEIYKKTVKITDNRHKFY